MMKNLDRINSQGNFRKRLNLLLNKDANFLPRIDEAVYILKKKVI